MPLNYTLCWQTQLPARRPRWHACHVGRRSEEKQAKVSAAADLWTPAVNSWGGLGRWVFLEVTHMENAADLVRAQFLDPAGAGA